MRRTFFLLLSLLLSLPLFAVSLAAQDATPTAGGALADLGLPTLDVTVNADAFEGIPDSLEAGRYLVTATAGDEVDEFGGGVAFIQPSGMTGEEFIAMFSGMSGEGGPDAGPATPADMAVTDASPEAAGEEEMGGLPPVFYESPMAGGVYAPPGMSAQVVLDLTPGEWVAWGDSPFATQQPVVFEVTGEMPADLVEPASSATLTMSEYAIEVTAGELTAGTHVIRVDNAGAQPHFVGWVQGPDGLTEEQIQTVLDEEMQAEMTGTPPAYSDFNPEEDLMDVTFTATQSTGTSQWVVVENVEAGTHVLICFVEDIEDGMPHAFHGMVDIVEIPE
jgi:hypothetical protein